MERLAEAFHGRGKLARAREALAAIESLGAEDFRAIADDPGKMSWPATHGAGQVLGEAFMDALVARWLVVDPEGAVAEMLRANSALVMSVSADGRRRSVRFGHGMLPKALARVRPEVLIASWPSGDLWSEQRSAAEEAFRLLGERDYRQARALAGGRAGAERAAVEGFAKIDPLGAVALAREVRASGAFSAALAAAERRGPGLLHQVALAVARNLEIRHRVVEWAIRFPDEPWDAVADAVENRGKPPIGESFTTTAGAAAPPKASAEECRRALAQAENFSPKLRATVIPQALLLLAREDAPAALAGLARHPEAAGSETRDAVFDKALAHDVEAALAWWKALPADASRDALASRGVAHFGRAGDPDTAIRYFTPGMSPESANALAAAQARRDPAAAARWLDSLPPETVPPEATASVIRQWLPRNPEAVAQWVESLPAGARRDSAQLAYAQAAAARDPAAAAAWAGTVSDPTQRARAAEAVFAALARSDPAAARAWVRDFPGVTEEWRASFLRRQK